VARRRERLTLFVRIELDVDAVARVISAAALTLPNFLDAITRKTKTLRKLQGGASWNFGRRFYSG
jgi:hypothetical protein